MLGPEFGGTVGVVLFASNVAACCLYLLGFVEAMLVNHLLSSVETEAFGHLTFHIFYLFEKISNIGRLWPTWRRSHD